MYDKMFQFVNECLKENDIKATEAECFPFRKWSAHIRRVFLWNNRLIE